MVTILTYIISIVAGVLGGLLVGYGVYSYTTGLTMAQLTEWLIFAVAEAEKALGSGTGQLKLRYVYDKALEKFPTIVNKISFEKFSDLVDIALAKFKEMLKNNTNVQKYVGEEVTESKTEVE